jgi:hypothetical protein
VDDDDGGQDSWFVRAAGLASEAAAFVGDNGIGRGSREELTEADDAEEGTKLGVVGEGDSWFVRAAGLASEATAFMGDDGVGRGSREELTEADDAEEDTKLGVVGEGDSWFVCAAGLASEATALVGDNGIGRGSREELTEANDAEEDTKLQVFGEGDSWWLVLAGLASAEEEEEDTVWVGNFEERGSGDLTEDNGEEDWLGNVWVGGERGGDREDCIGGGPLATMSRSMSQSGMTGEEFGGISWFKDDDEPVCDGTVGIIFTSSRLEDCSATFNCE